jgi:SAM-dependent methyltransferase
MSTLREKIKLRNDLFSNRELLLVDHVIEEKINLLNIIKSTNSVTDYNYDIDQQIIEYQNIIGGNLNIINNIEKLITRIEEDIDTTAAELFKNAELLCNESLSTTSELENIVQTKINKYSTWRFPGAQFYCRYANENNWQIKSNIYKVASSTDRINAMVANDPLYFIDSDIKLLKEYISVYPEIYQKRVRLYEIKDKNLGILPQNQFGFIYCWDFLNYQFIENIEYYLTEVFKLLRAGGVFMFSYNNCDILASIELAENHKAAWSNPRILKKLFDKIGYELICFENYPTDDMFDNYVSWVEVRRPGNLHTVKLNQSMGKILSK